MKNNLHYFKESISNAENVLDENYMSLSKNDNLIKYEETTIQIKKILTTIEVLSIKNNIDESLYKDLHNLIFSEFGGKNEFNCFANACNTTVFILKNDFESFKGVVGLYLQNRDISDYTPKEWIQSLIDKGSQRNKGCNGENKLLNIIGGQKYKKVENWDNFHKNTKSVAIFKKGVFDLQSIKTELGINLNFNTQGKMLDLIIKNDKKIMFLEAKHLKESGGAQDKQVKELLNIIQKDLSENNFYLGAFLDGVYSNKLLDISSEDIENTKNIEYGRNKLNSQKFDLITALKLNKNNFWFNTTGFTKFIKDF